MRFLNSSKVIAMFTSANIWFDRIKIIEEEERLTLSSMPSSACCDAGISQALVPGNCLNNEK